MKHTATPWVYHSGMVWKPDKTGTDDTPIAKMDRDTPRTAPTERDANAEFIVQAVNSHDSLVAILEQIIKDVDDCFETSDLRKFYDRMVANAKDTELALKGDKGNQRFIERIIDRATDEGGSK